MNSSVDPVSIFERFVQASTFRCIQQTFFQLCCALDIHPCDSTDVYRKVRQLDNGKLYSKAGKLWSLLDKKWNQPEYCSQKACNRLNVLIIGAGPCGLRAAIECALLGAHVVVVERRDKFSRNNVLHLWNFVIQDLKSLGAKIFFPKFCTGSIEHISIRRLQCILLKVALVLGVQVYGNVSFTKLLEPSDDDARIKEDCGWKASFEPHNHILSEYEFNVLIGADGKRNVVPGFPRKVVRGKLAIGITANFSNNRTAVEEKVMEISGVAYIFNQSFFNGMLAKTGIDLENIVYYKDDTHYFVMSAKKQSLLQKGVIRQDFEDISMLLSKDNVDQEMLCKYAAQAADFATNGKLPQLTFARNANLEPDVAMFDFTALSSAVYSTRLSERKSQNLIMAIVGDSLHEPFWPTGSGCARGFLGVFDTAWMLRSFGLELAGPTEIIADRENVYRLLAQTTKENLCATYSKYTIDPKTRYKQIGEALDAEDICEQIDTDSPRLRPTSKPLSLRISTCCDETLNLPLKFSRRLRLWLLCYRILLPLKLRVINFKVQSWGDGRALAMLIGRFRPDLLDYTTLYKDKIEGDELVEALFSAMEMHYKLKRPCSANLFAWSSLTDEQRMLYIESVVCFMFSDKKLIDKAIISSATPRAEPGENESGEERRRSIFSRMTNSTANTSTTDFRPLISNGSSVQRLSYSPTSTTNSNTPSTRSNNQIKRPNVRKLNPAVVEKVNRMVFGSWEKEKLQKFYDEKSRNANSMKAQTGKSADSTSKTVEKSIKKNENNDSNTVSRIAPQLDIARQRQKCSVCGIEAYLAEQMYLEKMIIHKRCFKCSYCDQPLRLDNCSIDHELGLSFGLRLFCNQHSQLPQTEKLNKLEKYCIDSPPALSVAVVPAVVRSNDTEGSKSCKDTGDQPMPPESVALRTMQRIRWRGIDAADIHADCIINKERGNDPISSDIAEKEGISLVTYRQQKMIDALKSMKQNCDNYSPIGHSSAFTYMASPLTCTSSDAQRYSQSNISSYGDSELANPSPSSSDSETEDDNEEVWTKFTEMLECMLNDDSYFINKDFLGEKNIRQLLEKFNRRSIAAARRRPTRAAFGSTNDLFRTPTQHDTSVYFTPKSSFPSANKQWANRGITSSRRSAQNGQNIALRDEIVINHENDNSRTNRENRLLRSNPRRATINIDVRMAQIDLDNRKGGSETETVYSTTEFSEPTSGVLIRKQRRDRLRNKDLNAEIQDIGRISSSKRRARSQSSANFSALLSSFRAMLNESDDNNGHNSHKLLLTPENISRAKQSAQAVIARREKEQKLDAYQIRRSLDEVERRIDEVREVGRDLERQLCVDPQNEWMLENWMFYTEELRRLRAREAQLSKRAQLIRTSEKYQRLRDELHNVQALNSHVRASVLGDGLEKEGMLMEKMLAVINEHKSIKSELQILTEDSSSSQSLAIEEVRQILADKQYDFTNFDPIFL